MEDREALEHTNDRTEGIKQKKRENAIRKMSSRVWGVTSPKSFQVDAIMNLSYTKRRQKRELPVSTVSASDQRKPTVTAVIRNTSDGKTHVVNGAATLLRGVCLSSLFRCKVLGQIKLPSPAVLDTMYMHTILTN